MKHMAFCLTVLLTTVCFARQQGQPPPDMQQLSHGTPPAFPSHPQLHGQPAQPPDMKAPPPRPISTEEAQQQITAHLISEPALAQSKVGAHVTNSSVVLRGRVASEEQHDLAVRIARSYAGDRKIVDKVKVTQ
jgi:BON domain